MAGDDPNTRQVQQTTATVLKRSEMKETRGKRSRLSNAENIIKLLHEKDELLYHLRDNDMHAQRGTPYIFNTMVLVAHFSAPYIPVRRIVQRLYSQDRV